MHRARGICFLDPPTFSMNKSCLAARPRLRRTTQDRLARLNQIYCNMGGIRMYTQIKSSNTVSYSVRQLLGAAAVHYCVALRRYPTLQGSVRAQQATWLSPNRHACKK